CVRDHRGSGLDYW
nr:immunoglobulin heavy chain junction region [Macaca mulatta]